MKKGILVVHGVGNHWNNREGWSDKIKETFIDRYYYAEAIWNNVTQPDHINLYNNLYDRKHRSLIKRFIFDFVMDATSFDKYKDEMKKVVYSKLEELEKDCEKIYIVAYSLGTWITYDMLRSHVPAKVKKFVTFGTNFPYRFVNDYDSIPGITWHNIWENSDVLSMPLKREGITDIEYKSWNWLLGWNPLAHIEYQMSSKFCKILKGILDG